MLEGVASLELNKVVASIEAPLIGDEIYSNKASNSSEPVIEWNIQHVNAHKSWRLVAGEGVTVANIDTGVLYTHEALFASYRGYNAKTKKFDHEYNWYDPGRKQKIPYDNNNHGTHTMGTIVGKTENNYHIGVAHKSRWIAAKGCATGSCYQKDLLDSAQFVLCPTGTDGKNPDCGIGADVVSNSWGGGRGNAWFKPAVDAWIQGGIVPVFSQGNSGPRCGSANSPADMDNVIGVGSTNKKFALSRFSSRGPATGIPPFAKLKPEIAAPGEQVVSSTPDGKYRAYSGTSMAGPHVAGVAALLLAANPSMNFKMLQSVLYSTARKTDLLAPEGPYTECGGIKYTTFPNYFYGHGLIDSFPAVKKAKSGPKEPPTEGGSDETINAISDLIRSLIRVGLAM